MAESKKVTTLRLPEPLHDRVARAAETENRSMNNYIARLLDQYVPEDNQMALVMEDPTRRAEAS